MDALSVTKTALEQMAQTPDPRLRAIMASLVQHLHDFAREVAVTPDEWLEAIRFLTATGQACTPIRQEFILLSDVLGLSSVVNMLHDETAVEACTLASNLGPFYRTDAPAMPLGSCMAMKAEANLVIYGRVLDTKGVPIPHARVQIWQPDDQGYYDLQIDDGGATDLRANFLADQQGRFWARSILPRGYMIPMDGPVGDLIRAQHRHGFRPAHIHFLVGAEGYREVVTALYLADDSHIDSDTVFGVSDPLIVSPILNDPLSPMPGLPGIRYDFHLSRAENVGSGRVGADPSQIVPHNP